MSNRLIRRSPALVVATLAIVSLAACAAAIVGGTAPAVGDFRLSGVSLRADRYRGSAALRLEMPRDAWQDAARDRLRDRNFMAWLPIDFGDGTVEVDVASDLAPGAPAFARGFVGLAFRIDAAGRFETIYLRPTNAMADDQVRRNRSIQYAAYPDHRFDTLRVSDPGRYESYAPIATGRWIHLKLVVAGTRARLFINRRPEPALIVTDLKLGAGQHGGVGVWLESASVVHFRHLQITRTGVAR